MPQTSKISLSASGLHVVHAAALLLAAMPKTTKPADLVARLKDDVMRARIETALAKKGLVEKEVRALAEACGMHLYRPNAPHPFDPLKPEPTDNGYWVAVIGDRPERRYVLIIKHLENSLVVADPAGAGLTSTTPEQFSAVWKLAARNCVSWAGCLWIDRPTRRAHH